MTGAGLFGTFRAQPGSGSIVALGADPARLLIQSAEVVYPAATLQLGAALELFGKDVGCGGVSAAMDAAGALDAQVSCTPRNPVSLVGGGSRTQIALLNLAGNFAFNPTTSVATYDIAGAGQFRLDASGANCGASMQLRVQNSGVSVSQFTPRCDPGEGTSNVGWLETRLSSLQMKRFAYTAGTGFDFELSVDLMPLIPSIPGFTLPTLAAVGITQNGLSIPAIDVTINRDPITVAGFGMKLRRVTLPAFTLSWADWEGSSAAAFRFGFDADFTMPNLPGEAACLTAEPISIRGAEISNGRLKAPLAERRFTPACGITLQSQTRLASSDVGLTQVSNSGVMQQGGTGSASGDGEDGGSGSGSGGGDGGGTGGASGGGGGGNKYFAAWLAMVQSAVPGMPKLGSCASPESRAAYGAWKTGVNSEDPNQVFAWPPCLDPSDISEWNAWENIEEPLPPPPLVGAFEELGSGNFALALQKANEERKKYDDKVDKAYDEYQDALDNPPCDIRTAECRKRIDDLRAKWEKERKDKDDALAKSPLQAMVSFKHTLGNCYAIQRQKELLGAADTTQGSLEACSASEALEFYRNNVLLPALTPPWYDQRTGQPIPGYTPDPKAVRRWCDNGYRDAAQAYVGAERQAQMIDQSTPGLAPVLTVGRLCVWSRPTPISWPHVAAAAP